MLAFDLALLSDRGGRKYNEDACGHWQGARHLCCVLADGAGGHGGGDVASHLAVQAMIDCFAQAPSACGTALAGLVRQTNDLLIAQRVPGTASADMHSTLVCLVIDAIDHRAHWAHAGDSRLYWFREGHLHRRTRDHSLVQALVDGGLLPESATRNHPRRSELRSALGLAAGMLDVSSGDGGAPVRGGDVFLLCSDGLWEYVDDAALEGTLAAAATPRAWLDALEAEVRRAASHRPGHDNFTALAVQARELQA